MSYLNNRAGAAVSALSFAVAIALSGAAQAASSVGTVAVGDGASHKSIASVRTGAQAQPELVTVTALSSGQAKDGTAANVMLLNSHRVVGVTGADSGVGNGVSVSNAANQPVLSSAAIAAMTGGVGQ